MESFKAKVDQIFDAIAGELAQHVYTLDRCGHRFIGVARDPDRAYCEAWRMFEKWQNEQRNGEQE